MVDKPVRDVQTPILFEMAWEVANKVGGIYTVIKTKAPVTMNEFGDRYTLLGPWVAHCADVEVEPTAPPEGPLSEAIQSMRDAGVRILYGRWLIEGYPAVLLFDVNSVRNRLGEWLGDLWREAGISCPESDRETCDAILFGYVVAWFLGLYAWLEPHHAIIAHGHEWLGSVALILAQKRQLDICSIFTTHATLLGRYLCAGNVDFYNHLSQFNVDYEAGKRGIYHRYCVERAAAHCAHVFTVVSHVTGYEAENLLKRKPDGVLPNGLNVIKFSAMHEFQNLHASNKEKIHEFVRGHFYGYYDFNLDQTLYFFTAGRYEYRNKGVDMYLEALARLNYSLKHFNSPMTVVAFIIMPAATQSHTVEALKGQAVTKQLRDSVQEIQERVGRRIFESALRGQMPQSKDLLSEQDLVILKRRIYALKRHTLPPIVTHNMADDGADPILMELRRLKLFNAPDDRVKIVYHPEFLNANNPVLGMDYEDFVRGCHLGVFPSYYEPWGYTPAECTVMGVPSITTNLSGFGCFIDEHVEDAADYGIYIIDRRTKSVEDSVQQLVSSMLSFCQKSRRQRINQRNRTERLSEILDWKRMGLEYVKARQLALRRVYPDQFDDEDMSSDEEYHQHRQTLIQADIISPTLQHPTDLLQVPDHDYDTVSQHPDPEDRIPRPRSAPTSPKLRAALAAVLGSETQQKMVNDLAQLEIHTKESHTDSAIQHVPIDVQATKTPKVQ